MADWLRLRWIGAFAGLALAACANQIKPNVSDATLVQNLQDGDALLNCEIECELTWLAQRPKALMLHNTAHWRELALLVMRVGYRSDLTYYYLGRAADGLGYLHSAERYYHEGERLSGSDLACAKGALSTCDGFVFPEDIEPLLKGVQAALNPPPPPPPKKRIVRRHFVRKPVPTAAAASNNSAFIEPPAETATGQNAGQTPPPPTTGRANPTGFVEPPARPPGH